MKTRTLGLLGMITSPFLATDFIVSGMYENYRTTPLSGIFSLVYMTGWIACIIGLYRLKATGDTVIGKRILLIQLAFLSLAELWNVYAIIEPGANTVLYRILDAFWPISNSFMLVTGLAVIFARKIQGWKRYVPFIVGLWLPIALVSIPLSFGNNNISLFTASIYSATAWLLLGFCVYTSATEMEDIQATKSPAPAPALTNY